ncbi:hypothetical protein [Serratia plymuthica]|uniref:hypothetical protein n=1 Tax=Serratia plymuthica TaxID=82996 RepID=UPI00338DDC3B
MAIAVTVAVAVALTITLTAAITMAITALIGERRRRRQTQRDNQRQCRERSTTFVHVMTSCLGYYINYSVNSPIKDKEKSEIGIMTRRASRQE